MRKGGVDNHNSTSKYAKSLNKEARKKELHKITTENQVCSVNLRVCVFHQVDQSTKTQVWHVLRGCVYLPSTAYAGAAPDLF